MLTQYLPKILTFLIAVAAVLRDRIGYRGALGVDGVMTADGFRPTELNPRCSVGLSIQGQGPETPDS